jgi:hypothetical protein
MNRDDHGDREAVKRAIIRANKTVPDHDAEDGSWPHDRATAYAASAVKGGLYKGVRAKGNGRDVARQIVPMFRNVLGPMKEDSLRFDQLVADSCRDGTGVPALAVAMPEDPADPEWAISDGLEKGIVCIVEDDGLFESVAVNGASAFDDDRSGSVVLAAWRDDSLVHLHAQALAGGVHGVRGIVLEADGTIADVEQNHTARFGRDVDAFVAKAASVISEGLRTLAPQTDAMVDDGGSEALPIAGTSDTTMIDGPVGIGSRPPQTWEDASAPVRSPLLDATAASALAVRTRPNAALEKLRRELETLLSPDADASVEKGLEAPTPFDAIAMRQAIEGGHVERFVATMRDNAKAHATEHRRAGRESDAAEVERLILQATGDEGRQSVVSHVADDVMGHMRATYDAASRRLAAATEAPDDAAFGALEIEDADEDVPLRTSRTLHGVHAVKWRSLHDAAIAAMEPNMKARAGLAMVVLHSTDADGSSAQVLQMMDGKPTMGAWRRLDPVPLDGEDDLSWCLRKVVGASISTLGHALVEAGPSAAAVITTDPVPVVKDATASGGASPIVAAPPLAAAPSDEVKIRDFTGHADRQWLRPASCATVSVEKGPEARALVDAWFSDLAGSAGERLVTDRATPEGEWLVEWTDPMQNRLQSVGARMSGDRRTVIEIMERGERIESHKTVFPSLIARLAARMAVWGPDGHVSATAGVIHDAESMMRFKRLASDPDRLLPLLLLSTDQNIPPMVDPDSLARSALGAMHVWLLQGYMVRELDSSWGNDLVPHKGCARLYRTGFHPDTDNKFQNPLYMNTSDGQGHVRSSVARAMRDTLERYGDSTRGGSALGAALKAAINPIAIRIEAAKAKAEAVEDTAIRSLPLRSAPASSSASTMVMEMAEIEETASVRVPVTVPEDHRERDGDRRGGMRSIDLEGLFDDPEDVDDEDDRVVEAPARRATRKRAATVRTDELAALLAEAMRPVIDRLERIEAILGESAGR